MKFFAKNSAGGRSFRFANVSIFTDPYDKFWPPRIYRDYTGLRIYLGWLNIIIWGK